MIILKRGDKYFLQYENKLYPLEIAYKLNLIPYSLAKEIVDKVEKLSADSGNDEGIYVEVYLKEKEEKELAIIREGIRKQYQDLWQYPDISSLPLETLEKIANKSLHFLEGMDVGYGVYAHYRDKQRSEDKLFRDAAKYIDLVSFFNSARSKLKAAIQSKKKDSILKELETFHNYAREAYIFAKSFDTVSYDYEYIAKAMNLDLEFVTACLKENNPTPKESNQAPKESNPAPKEDNQTPKEKNPTPVVFSNMALSDSNFPQNAAEHKDEDITDSKIMQAAKLSGEKI